MSKTIVFPKLGIARINDGEVEASEGAEMLIRTDHILVNHRTSYEDVPVVYGDLLTDCLTAIGVLCKW